MSFVISPRQSLATDVESVHYKPFIVPDDRYDVVHIDVNFGHPLYTSLTDIVHITSRSEETVMVPLIPDGCMKLLFLFKEDDDIEGYFCGVFDEIRKIELKHGEQILLLSFLPGVGRNIMKSSGTGVLNMTVNLDDVAPWSKQVRTILANDNEFTERVKLISRVIKVKAAIEAPSYIVKNCTEQIIEAGGNIKMEELAEKMGFTARHIGKEFEKNLGISPKLFAQIVKLQVTMNRIVSDRDALLVDIAVDSGFFDHAHMNRMYKKMIHCSSGEFRKHFFNRFDYSGAEDLLASGQE